MIYKLNGSTTRRFTQFVTFKGAKHVLHSNTLVLTLQTPIDIKTTKFTSRAKAKGTIRLTTKNAILQNGQLPFQAN